MEALKMPRLAFMPTLACNLRCRLCATSSPYYAKPSHPTIENLCLYVDRIFEIAMQVGEFIFSGGEPLLRNDLPIVINHLHKYADNIEKLTIITNGTIVPSNELIKAFAKYGDKLYVMIDDYGSDLSVNAEKIATSLSVLNNANIERRKHYGEHTHCGGWVDYGVSSENKKSIEEAKLQFSKCANPQIRKFCMYMVDGILYPCYRLLRSIELRISLPFDYEYFDLFDDRFTVDQQRERIDAAYHFELLSSCMYCNGMREDSERFAPAEQLSAEEIKLLRK